MVVGIYEELVTRLIENRLQALDANTYYLNKSKIDKTEASLFLSRHLSTTIKSVLDLIKGEKQVEEQIEIANKIIQFLKEELGQSELSGDLVETEGEILKAVLHKTDAHFADLDLRLREITPFTRLAHSELFTGGNIGLSLESELKKEILSADRIDLLVSFIKFKGIIILAKELEEFTQKGGKLRVITTTYMGASDYKAIQLLSQLSNTEVKISYNTGNERLHAKAYLFFRNSGFHTGYIGSSNFSRSALTDGLEWNIKITTKEVGHVIDKFQKTFESYWHNGEFEQFDEIMHREKLTDALKVGKNAGSGILTANAIFDIKPYPFQEEILEKLEVERAIHGRFRNLVVAATGTGKTVISAFDYQNFSKNNHAAKLLFIAHRKEILEQAASTFRGILKDNNFGELWVDGMEPGNFSHVFASIQTLNNRLLNLTLSADYYDFIVIDECHHLTADSYRGILQYFNPKILLGLTATPERMDGGDIKGDFQNKIAAEIRLPEALDRKLLCPFQYFGISDSVDLSSIRWFRGKYDASELTNIYTSSDRRVGEIIAALQKYTKDHGDVRALGFCISIDHAKFMAQKFTLAELKAEYLTSSTDSTKRKHLRRALKSKEINYLFVVDIFNEGVDLPEIDTVLFLRPTESLTVFLQQLGRGLRLSDGKDCLTVLDFVGNARPEYNFENKFRALIGKTSTPVKKEIEANFPHLPLGCSIILEKKAKEVILNNIKAATRMSEDQLILKIQSFENQSTAPLTLRNFIEFYDIPLQLIYKRNKGSCWKRLLQKAGIIPDFIANNESEIYRAIKNKWLATASLSYFNFIIQAAKVNFQIQLNNLSNEEKAMALMLYYDVWQDAGLFGTLEASIHEIGANHILVDEIIEVLEIVTDQIAFKEIDIELPYKQPLRLHARYTRDQILAAFGLSTFENKSTNREGTAFSRNLKTELLFVNLVKSEEDFSPTTMYDDYAINETMFHWQSQNRVGPETDVGQSYIHHVQLGKKILLFIREKSEDEFGNTMGFVFVGAGTLRSYYGSKPMSIEWEINEPLPHYLWKNAAKLQVG